MSLNKVFSTVVLCLLCCLANANKKHAVKHATKRRPTIQLAKEANQEKIKTADTLNENRKKIKNYCAPFILYAPSVNTNRNYVRVPLAGQKEYFGSKTPFVNQFVVDYFNYNAKTLSVVHARSMKQFPLIDHVFTKHNLPKELKYLAVIESALNNKAVSPVGAVGPWQFMSSTANLFGLKTSARRDDRRDWFKSTEAAAKYLSYLYEKYNDWLLVIAAYNSGPTPVSRAIERTGSTNFWDIKKQLPLETQGHVLAFIATASIFEKLSPFIPKGSIPENIFDSLNQQATKTAKKETPKSKFTEEELKRMQLIRISEPISLEIMAEIIKTDARQLERWNDDLFLQLNKPGDKTYWLRLPKDKIDAFLSNKEEIIRRSKQFFGEIRS
ncbi:MAG: lytic transglycosylase domain-containing protein [Bacteroidota bacterium]|jgi:membrane-bound lytic murein transglycosylase D|nr:lytic transglycosylase domain-containing protein [Bacteroidota bacterium]